MSDLFVPFLESAATPEYKELLELGYKALTDVGIDTHTGEIDQLIAANGDNRDETLQWVDQLIRLTLIDSIAEYGVAVKDDIRLNSVILEALAVTIEDYEDVDRLDAILGMDLDPTDLLAEILESVTPYKVEEFLPHLDDVSQHLIDRLESIVLAKVDTPVLDVQVIQYTIKRFNLWKRLQPTEEGLLAYRYLLEGGRFTAPLADMVTPYLPELKALGNLNAMGIQLLGFALASDLTNAEIPQQMNLYLDQLGVTPFDMATAMKSVDVFLKLLDEASSNE